MSSVGKASDAACDAMHINCDSHTITNTWSTFAVRIREFFPSGICELVSRKPKYKTNIIFLLQKYIPIYSIRSITSARRSHPDS